MTSTRRQSSATARTARSRHVRRGKRLFLGVLIPRDAVTPASVRVYGAFYAAIGLLLLGLRASGRL